MNKGLITAASVAAMILSSCSYEIRETGSGLYNLGFNVSVEQFQSKGELINTSGDTQDLSEFSSSISRFYLSGYDEDGGTFIPADTEISYDGSSWTAENRYLWPDGMTATFFAYANLPEGGTAVATTAEGQTLQYTAPLSAESQTDILLGFCRSSATSSATAVADITFRHPLASVIFKKGVMDGILSISSITITGIPGSGTLTVSPDAPTNYDWEVSNYSSMASLLSKGALPIDGDSRIGEPFFLIPQNLEEHPITVNVSATLSTGTKILSLPLASGSLQAGVTTVYTLTMDAKTFGVSIESSVSAETVSQIETSLLGNKQAFLRAAVTGNWIDNTGAITEGWAVENATASFVGLAGSNWTKNSDGFWYHTQAVSSSTDIPSLFTSFTRPAAREDGSQFQLDVLVQAVEATSGKTWQTAFSN